MLISSVGDIKLPKQFQDGLPIEHVIVVCDVDGVIRNSTEADADSQIVTLVKELVANHNIDIAFISGTPVIQNPFLETWRRGNYTLDKAVGKFFLKELEEGKVTIYGALGGQRMIREDQIDITDQYPPEIAFELGKLLLYGFLEEVKNKGNHQQKKYAEDLKSLIDKLKLINDKPTSEATADDFKEVIFKIHSQLDPHFRLVSYGAFVESQSSNPPWDTDHSLRWIQSQLSCPNLLVSALPKEQKELATGFAHRENNGFNFLIISKINKSSAIKKHLQEKLLLYPNALIITIGDTQVDFPMHQHAHLAYHVGQEQVWKSHCLSQCMFVRDQFGQDRQHVYGTRYILNSLKNNIGKPILDWNIYS